jgi:hypothetical protein
LKNSSRKSTWKFPLLLQRQCCSIPWESRGKQTSHGRVNKMISE